MKMFVGIDGVEPPSSRYKLEILTPELYALILVNAILISHEMIKH